MSEQTNIFGAVSMGYVVVESQKLDAWRQFCVQGLGMHLASAEADELVFRIDEHARRFIVRRGPAEDFAALGWQVKDQATLDVILARLQDRNIGVELSTDEAAAQRGVKLFWRVIGPKGLALELFIEAETSDAPLRMLTSGFVTGAGGMGHVAITSRLPEKMQRFWQEIFDARVSDRISQQMTGALLDVTFLRLNERHHSVAIAATRGVRLDPIRTKAQHMNLLAASLSDLSAAFERLRLLGYEMAHEIGEHPNDHELSFYVISPSGFEVELGWNALTVDESTWQVASYDAISIWGHRPQNTTAVHSALYNLGNLKRGAHSLLKPEYSPI